MPSNRPGLQTVEASLFFKMVRVVNLTARPFVESIGKEQRLSLSAWRVMVVLAAHPGCAAQEVVARTALDKMTVSRALAGLGRQGYLARSGDAEDRRRISLRLTAAGRKVYERVAERGRSRESQLFSGISAAERQSLARMLEKLARNIGDGVLRPEGSGSSPAKQARVRPGGAQRLAALGPQQDERAKG